MISLRLAQNLWNGVRGTGGLNKAAPGLFPLFQPSQNLRWRDSSRFIWTEGLQTLFVFQRLGKDSQDQGGIPHPLGVQGASLILKFPAAAVLYCYFYKRTAVHLGDPLFYQDSLWLRKEFAHFRG